MSEVGVQIQVISFCCRPLTADVKQAIWPPTLRLEVYWTKGSELPNKDGPSNIEGDHLGCE